MSLPPPSARSTRVLFAYGDEAMQALIRDALGCVGYEIELAADAGEALGGAAHAPDLILVETGLPDGGPALLAALRQLAPMARIVLLVRLGDEALGARARELGADVALAMPFHLAELQSAVADLRGPGSPLAGRLERQPGDDSR